MGKLDEAIILYKDYDRRYVVLGIDHPATLIEIFKLGIIYKKMCGFDKANMSIRI